MPLGDVSALHEWRILESPPEILWKIVNDWVDGLRDKSWQLPSIPFPDLSDPPEYEVRSAVIDGTTVEIFYKVFFATELVDLIHVHYSRA